VSTSHELLAQLEAVLMVVDEPVTVTELATALELDESDVAEGLQELVKDYRGETGSRTRGFVLRETGSGWRIYSAPEHDQIVGKFVTAGRMARLSQAALETLAVIAYRQPVTRGQIAMIRGVNVDGVVRTLLARDLITETGFDGPTGATLYKTTRYFMERMGIESLDDLPLLAPALPPIEESAELEELVSHQISRPREPVADSLSNDPGQAPEQP
jgi:segregation and condensation protein B